MLDETHPFPNPVRNPVVGFRDAAGDRLEPVGESVIAEQDKGQYHEESKQSLQRSSYRVHVESRCDGTSVP